MADPPSTPAQQITASAAPPEPLTLRADDRIDLHLHTLASDGAWTPLSLHALQRLVAASALGGFADLPERILEAAGRGGRADDMTVVACRLRAWVENPPPRC